MADAERKFVLDPAVAGDLLAELEPRLLPVRYDAERPIAWSRTTYLDSDDYLFLRTSAERTHRRLRVREYASAIRMGVEPRLSGTCMLELKETTGSFRTKVRCATAPEEMTRLMRGETPGSNLTMRTNLAWVALMKLMIEHHPLPRVTTLYRRETLGSPDGLIRITIDRDFGIYAPVNPGLAGQRAEPMEKLSTVKETIVEVKTLGDVPAWLTGITARYEEAEHFSKFKLAMEAVAGLASRTGT